MGPPRNTGWSSPRAMHGQNVSPRVMRPLTPGSQPSQMPFLRQPFLPSQHHAQPSNQPIVKIETTTVPDAVEVLSSDSSSSSDSDSQ